MLFSIMMHDEKVTLEVNAFHMQRNLLNVNFIFRKGSLKIDESVRRNLRKETESSA